MSLDAASVEIPAAETAGPPAPGAGESRTLDQIQKDELAELRGISMRLARKLGARAEAVLNAEAAESEATEPAAPEPETRPAVSTVGALLARVYNQLATGIRQIMVLERECAGLRPPPGMRAAPSGTQPARGGGKPPIDAQDFAVTDGDLFEHLPYHGALAHLSRAVDLAAKANPFDRFAVLGKLTERLETVAGGRSFWDWKQRQPDPGSIDELIESQAISESGKGVIRAFADHVDEVLSRPAPPRRGTGPP